MPLHQIEVFIFYYIQSSEIQENINEIYYILDRELPGFLTQNKSGILPAVLKRFIS